MATRKVKLVSITITDKQGGTYTAADTTTSNVGSGVFADFMAERTIKIPGNGSTTYLPFDNVAKAVVTISDSSVEYKDDNCQTRTPAEESGGEGGNTSDEGGQNTEGN